MLWFVLFMSKRGFKIRLYLFWRREVNLIWGGNNNE